MCLLWLAGCDHVLGLSAIGPVRDAGVDAPVDAAAICLADTFMADAIDLTTWTTFQATGTNVAETGELVVTLANDLPTAYAGIDTANSFDLSTAQTVIEVDAVPVGTSAQAQIAWKAATGDYFGITTDGSSLESYEYKDGVNTPLTTVPYDPANQRYWRIRALPETTTVALETSGDDEGWTTQATFMPPGGLSAQVVQIFAGTYQPVSSPGEAAFTNFVMAGNSCVP